MQARTFSIWNPLGSVINALWKNKKLIFLLLLACIPEVSTQQRLILINKPKINCKDDFEGFYSGDLGDGYFVTVKAKKESPRCVLGFFVCEEQFSATMKLERSRFPHFHEEFQLNVRCAEGHDRPIEVHLADSRRPIPHKVISEITLTNRTHARINVWSRFWNFDLTGTLKKEIEEPKIDPKVQSALDVLSEKLTPDEIEDIRSRLTDCPSTKPCRV